VFLFPAAAFDAVQNPAEPPRFGIEVRRAGGTTLSVAGPQDSIFDPRSLDGKNISALYELTYRPSTYRTTVE
jgi:hypothetical protein